MASVSTSLRTWLGTPGRFHSRWQTCIRQSGAAFRKSCDTVSTQLARMVGAAGCGTFALLLFPVHNFAAERALVPAILFLVLFGREVGVRTRILLLGFM